MTVPDAPTEILQDRADRPVLRIGDIVRHPAQPWSASVHALLEFLNESGFTQAPLPGPIDGADDDVAYIAGVSGDDACALVQSDSAVAAVAQTLRRFHDTVAAWEPEVELTWFDGQAGTGTGEQIVCHGDVGPWNLVWQDAELVGLIDWEYATVGTRRSDVAYALHYLAPFRDRSYWEGVLGMATKPRRRHRMAVFADAYGIAVDEELVQDVLASQRAGVHLMLKLAERGASRQQQLIADGELEREQRAVDWGQAHQPKLRRRQKMIMDAAVDPSPRTNVVRKR